MISHVPGPVERLARRLSARWEHWIDGLCADPSAPPRSSGSVVQPVQPRGLPAMIADALSDGRVKGLSQREIARRFNTSKSTVQRAQVLVRETAEA
jgi:hypothetical protein